MIRNKKGFTAFEDILFVLVYLFAAALLIFVLYYAYQQIKDPMDVVLSTSVNASQTSFNYTTMSNNVEGGINMLNLLFPFLLLGLIIMTAVSAMFVESHPVFFFVSLIILGIVILLSVTYSNIYQQITENSNFGTTDTDLNVMAIFMRNLPIIAVVTMVITIIVLFTNSGGSKQL